MQERTSDSSSLLTDRGMNWEATGGRMDRNGFKDTKHIEHNNIIIRTTVLDIYSTESST